MVAPLWPAIAGGGAPPVEAARLRHQNDEGFEMKFGEGGILYCGRNLGKAAIPGSDGVCGPHDGPQCNSCKRYLIPAPPGTKVYAVLGHGCDVTSIKREPIPAGSYYITVEECGGVSADLPKILYGFNDTRVNSRDIRLLDGNRSFQNMVNYFSIGLPAARPFKVRGPGRDHTVGLNSLFAQLDMTHMGGCIIVKSGLYEMGNVPYINNIPGKIYMTFPNIDDPRVPRGSIIILRSDLEEIYRGSLYFPDYDYIFGGFPAKIVTLNNLNTAIARSFSIKYHGVDAFTHRYAGMYKVINNREKGIIYNLACRVDCNNDMQSAARAMMASRENNGYGAMNRGIGAGPMFNNVMFDYIDKWAIQMNLIKEGERGGIRGGAYEREGPARLLPGLLPRLSGGSQRRKITRKDRRRRTAKCRS